MWFTKCSSKQEEANVLMFNAGRDDLFKCSNVQREEETTCPRFNHRIADMPHVRAVCGFSAFDTQVWIFLWLQRCKDFNLATS